MIAAGKEERPHHVRIRRERQALPAHLEHARVMLRSSSVLRKAGTNIRPMSWCINFPPPPCASRTFG